MIGIDPSYGLYGNVVVVGNAEQGLRDVPDRLVERFGPTRDVSLGDRIRDVLRDRNEDGMIRFPWLKEPSISTPDVMSHHPKWVAENQGDRTVYYREGDWDGHAAVWRDHGRWSMNYAYDPEYPMQEADLGRVRSEKTALDRAELVLREHYRFVRQSYEDTKAVVNLAQEVEDRTPAEQLAIERLQTAIEENPPPRAPDPDDGWLKVFESEMSDRGQQRDQDQDRGV